MTIPISPFTLNRKSPQARGLVGWWPTLGLRSGAVLRDASGYGVNGASSTTIAYTSIPVAGGALYLTGDGGAGGDFYNLGLPGHLDITGKMTVMSVAYPFVTNYRQTVFYRGETANENNEYWMIRFSNTATIQFNMEVGGSTVSGSVSSYSANTWYWVVMRYDGSNVDGFLNGVNIFQSAASGAQDGSTRDILIGAKLSGYYGLYGYLAETRIYNWAVPDSLIWQMYDPATRWDLYAPLGRVYAVPSAAAAGNAMPMAAHYYRMRRAG